MDNIQTVVLTGGLGLLGRTIAQRLSKDGYNVVLSDILTPSEVDPEFGKFSYYQMDITNTENVESVLAQVIAEFGSVYALINNAYPRNRNYGRGFFDVEYADFCENVSSHLGGYFLTSKIFARYFKKSGSGTILNMASIYGVVAPRFEIYADTKMGMPVEYAAIKSAIIHLTRYMAKYFSGDNIRVNAVSPGGIYDGQDESFVEKYNQHSPQGRMLDADEIAGVISFLLSEDGYSINGQNLVVDGGWTL